MGTVGRWAIMYRGKENLLKTSHCEKIGKGSKEGLGNGGKRFHYCFSVKEGKLIKRGHYAKGKRGMKELKFGKHV